MRWRRFIRPDLIQLQILRARRRGDFETIIFVVNPRGANGKTDKQWKKLLPYLRSRLDSHCNFLDLFGDAQSVTKADYRHSKLFSSHKSSTESRKRHAEDYLVSERTKLSKSVIPTSAPSVMGAYPTTQSQWATGYGVQPQAWPQASQTQPQQWNVGYAQQATYGSYGTSYTHAQAPTSVAQSATYATYPPTYPA